MNMIIRTPVNDIEWNMNKSDWDFPIATHELQTFQGASVPKSMSQAIVRTDTNEVLGVNGSKYKPIEHDDVVNSILDAVSDANVSQDYSLNVETFANGAKMRCIINFHDFVI